MKAAERKAKGLPKWGMDEYGDAWGQLSQEAQAEYGPGGSKAPKAKAPVEADEEIAEKPRKSKKEKKAKKKAKQMNVESDNDSGAESP